MWMVPEYIPEYNNNNLSLFLIFDLENRELNTVAECLQCSNLCVFFSL